MLILPGMALQVTISFGYIQVVAITPTITPKAASTTSQVLAPYDTDRVHLAVHNQSTGYLYLAWGPTASLTLFTVRIPPNGFYELPPRQWIYAGVISGIWDVANGQALVTVAT